MGCAASSKHKLPSKKYSTDDKEILNLKKSEKMKINIHNKSMT